MVVIERLRELLVAGVAEGARAAKDEAEKIKKQLEAAGAKVELK